MLVSTLDNDISISLLITINIFKLACTAAFTLVQTFLVQVFCVLRHDGLSILPTNQSYTETLMLFSVMTELLTSFRTLDLFCVVD